MSIWGVEAVLILQEAMRPFDEMMAFISTASNPASVIHYLIPIICAYDMMLATQVLSAYILADVTNLMLKWPLKGDRPYWMDPRVRQFGANTCEVGYGMPSGHMQVTVAVYVLIALHFRRKRLALLVLASVILTGLSRIHMGAHTPLQVSAGLLAGALSCFFVRRAGPMLRAWASWPATRRAAYAAVVSAVVVAIVAIQYSLLLANGFDPDLSVQKAKQACLAGLHAAVSSFSGIGRDCGALLGFAAGLPTPPISPRAAAAAAAAAAAGRPVIGNWLTVLLWLGSLEAVRLALITVEGFCLGGWVALAQAAALTPTAVVTGEAFVAGTRYALLAWWGVAGRRFLSTDGSKAEDKQRT